MLKKGYDTYESKFTTKFKAIKQHHQGREVVHEMQMSSKAAHLFSQYYGLVIEWTKLHEYQLAYQDAITLVSKSLGQVLRLSAILNAFFLEWNKDEVLSYEQMSHFTGVIPTFRQTDNVRIPLSVMALQNALSIVTYSLTPNLLLQNISFSVSTSQALFRKYGTLTFPPLPLQIM